MTSGWIPFPGGTPSRDNPLLQMLAQAMVEKQVMDHAVELLAKATVETMKHYKITSAAASRLIRKMIEHEHELSGSPDDRPDAIARLDEAHRRADEKIARMVKAAREMIAIEDGGGTEPPAYDETMRQKHQEAHDFIEIIRDSFGTSQG